MKGEVKRKFFPYDWRRGIHAASSPKPHLFEDGFFSSIPNDAHVVATTFRF
jgi:hypothetical protein